MSKTYSLKLTGAIGLAGELKRAGAIVEVDEPTAKNLLHRGKAVPASNEDAPPAGDGQPDGGQGQKDAPKASAGLNVQQLKDALQAKGIDAPEGAKKAELAALLDAAAAAGE